MEESTEFDSERPIVMPKFSRREGDKQEPGPHNITMEQAAEIAVKEAYRISEADFIGAEAELAFGVINGEIELWDVMIKQVDNREYRIAVDAVNETIHQISWIKNQDNSSIKEPWMSTDDFNKMQKDSFWIIKARKFASNLFPNAKIGNSEVLIKGNLVIVTLLLEEGTEAERAVKIQINIRDQSLAGYYDF